MTRKRVAVYVLALLSLAEAAYFHEQRRWLGFPDGHLTQLGEVRKRAYLVFAAACVLASLLAAVKSRGERGVKIALVALPMLSALLWAVDFYLGSVFDDGGGG